MKLITCLSICFLLSCASSSNRHGVIIGEVEGDIRFRVVGSYGQEELASNLFSGTSEIPIEGFNLPIDLLLNRSGVASQSSFDITKVGGSMTVEVIGTGIQNGKSYEVKSASEHILVGEYQSQIGE